MFTGIELHQCRAPPSMDGEDYQTETDRLEVASMNMNKRIKLVKRSEAVSRPIIPAPDQIVISRIENISARYLRTIMEDSIVSSEDLLQRKIQEEPFIMKPWIKTGSLTLVHGDAGIGKSLFCLAVAFAVTRKLQIGKWEVEKPVDCLYLDAEMTAGDLQYSLKILEEDLPQKKADLMLLTSEDMYLKYGMVPDLTNEKWRDGISALVREDRNIGLLILDNLSSLAPYRNENSKMDWDPINQWLLSLRRMGKAVIVVQHEGKKKGTPRGTSGIRDNITSAIGLTDLNRGAEDEGAYFQVTFNKKGKAKGADVGSFCMKIEKDPDSGLPWTTSNLLGLNRRKYIVGLIGLGMKQRDIAEVLGCTEANVSQIKKKATKEGFFNEAGEPTEKWKETYRGDTVEDILREFKDN